MREPVLSEGPLRDSPMDQRCHQNQLRLMVRSEGFQLGPDEMGCSGQAEACGSWLVVEPPPMTPILASVQCSRFLSTASRTDE
ncbi:hypothetical protein MKX07_007051 [Trichoderma sp. CBMAI-0711]|nr:hypothetical protein MKX07_007051 [Trichoderma sp. CBMAI-0711]